MRYALIVMLLSSLCWSAVADADPSLKSSLQLDNEQARQVDQIDAERRKQFAARRGEFNRESRALRRAKLASDTAEIARLTEVTEGLRAELKQIRDDGDARIAGVLRPDQQPLFDDYIVQRRELQGASRDERLFD